LTGSFPQKQKSSAPGLLIGQRHFPWQRTSAPVVDGDVLSMGLRSGERRDQHLRPGEDVQANAVKEQWKRLADDPFVADLGNLEGKIKAVDVWTPSSICTGHTIIWTKSLIEPTERYRQRPVLRERPVGQTSDG
jgi:hypothetical protein